MEFFEFIQHKKSLKNTATRFWLHLLRRYFRIEVVGIENIPRKGPGLIISNHSGFAGADGALLAYIIKRATRRRARLLAHRAFFDFSDKLKIVSESFGLKKAGIASGVEILKRKQLLILFPEGEAGNFKATSHAYELQRFHTGFLRMALQTGAPIIPSFVIGAEESHLNLGNIDFSKLIRGVKIPLPLNFVPLPAKWKIVVQSPLDLRRFSRKKYQLLADSEFAKALLNDQKELERLAGLIQKHLQKAIIRELKHRPFIYFQVTRDLLDRVRSSKRLSELKSL